MKKTKTYHISKGRVVMPVLDVRKFGIIDLLENIGFVQMTYASVRVPETLFLNSVEPVIKNLGWDVTVKDDLGHEDYRRYAEYRAEFVRYPLKHGDIVETRINSKQERSVVVIKQGKLRISSGEAATWKRVVAVHSLIIDRVDPSNLTQEEIDKFAKIAGEPSYGTQRTWRITCKKHNNTGIEKYMQTKKAKIEEDQYGQIIYTLNLNDNSFKRLQTRLHKSQVHAYQFKIINYNV